MPVERRASMRTSMRLSVSPGEDDDYDMQMMGISDGFRPTNMSQPPQQPLPNPSIPLQPTPSTKSVQKVRPSSIAKPPQPRESFSLRHDGGMGSLADSIVAGSSSNAVGQDIARAESPYQGPSGPSFPYQMYTQNVRPERTNSLATTVTVPATERSYNGPNNPTHPYQMYPQNTVAASETEGRATPAIPVGFTGAVDNYQRRLGPEGEEAGDMIGPDGHTEQLPPYTRYPDEAYQRKIAGIGGVSAMEPSAAGSSASHAALAVGAASGSTSASTSVSSPSPRSSAGTTALHAIPGAGGLGLATRNPEFASTDDLSIQAGGLSPQSRQSLRSFNSEGGDNPQINTAAQAVLNEKKPAKKWQIIARRKVWGVVPCWALTITLIIIVMLAIVLGTVLGIFFNKPKKPPPPSDSSSATMNDASPLSSVPADLAALPSGEFALPLMLTRSPTTCFNDSTQAQAWNCNQVFAQLSLHIDKLSETPSTSQYAMSLHYNESFTIESNEYSYGMQPPKVNDVTMLLVTDINEPTRGPAWAFEVAYNKTVIIPEGLFPGSSSSSSSKRGSAPPPPPQGGGGGFPGGGDFKRKGLAQSGDKPWICSWDGTILEVFVYPNQNNSQPSLVYPDSSATSTGGGTTTATVTSDVSSSTATSSSTDDDDNESSEYQNVAYTSHHRRQASTSPATTTTTSTTATSTISSSGVFDTSVPSPSDFQVPFFPRVVKMEERRLAGSPSVQPYCRQYQINDNGPATPLTDSNGHPVEVKIVEIEPDEDSESSHERKSSRRERLVQRKVIEDYLNHAVKPRDSDSDMSNCGCMWWAT